MNNSKYLPKIHTGKSLINTHVNQGNEDKGEIKPRKSNARDDNTAYKNESIPKKPYIIL